MASTPTVNSPSIDGLVRAAAELNPQAALQEQQAAKEVEKIARRKALIEARISEINIDPQLKPEDKARLIAELRSDAHGNGPISNALMNSVRDTRAEADDNISESVVHQIAMADENGYTRAQWNRIRTRSQRLDTKNPESVRAFAESLVNDDVPKSIRADVVKDVSELLTKPEMKPVIERYNSTSDIARVAVNAEYEKTKADVKIAAKKPELKTEAERAEDLGSAIKPEVQKALDDNKKGKVSDTETKQILKRANDEQRQRVIENISTALTVVPEDVRKKAEAVGGPEEILKTARDVFKREREAKEQGKAPPKLTEAETAAMRVFLVAREKEIISKLADNAIAKDLEIGMGTPEQRIERAMVVLKEKSGGAFDKIPEQKLRTMVTSIITNADEKKYTVASLDELKNPQLDKYLNEVYEESWGRSFETGAKSMARGAKAILNGDESVAAQAALATGRGVKNVLNRVGGIIDEETAQAVGNKVTTALQASASSIIETKTTVENTAAKLSDTINATQVGWNSSEDITKSLEQLKSKGWDKLTVGGKQLFDLSHGDAKAVESIKKALADAKVNLADFDKNKSGSTDVAELTAALKVVYEKEVAALTPSNTPNIAKNQGPQPQRG